MKSKSGGGPNGPGIASGPRNRIAATSRIIRIETTPQPWFSIFFNIIVNYFNKVNNNLGCDLGLGYQCVYIEFAWCRLAKGATVFWVTMHVNANKILNFMRRDFWYEPNIDDSSLYPPKDTINKEILAFMFFRISSSEK